MQRRAPHLELGAARLSETGSRCGSGWSHARLSRLGRSAPQGAGATAIGTGRDRAGLASSSCCRRSRGGALARAWARVGWRGRWRRDRREPRVAGPAPPSVCCWPWTAVLASASRWDRSTCDVANRAVPVKHKNVSSVVFIGATIWALRPVCRDGPRGPRGRSRPSASLWCVDFLGLFWVGAMALVVGAAVISLVALLVLDVEWSPTEHSGSRRS